MKAKILVCALPVLILATIHLAEAQQPGKIPRIGYLSRDLHPSDSRAAQPVNLEAFRQGLQELGYVEGKNIIVEYRYGEGRLERLPTLAENQVRLKVETTLPDPAGPAPAAKKPPTTTPIVIASGGDPIQADLWPVSPDPAETSRV